MAGKPTIDWRALIQRGIESDEIDYKAAQNWRELPRAGKAKFARHCLALANTKGGYLVVGVGEDRFGRPADYTGLTDEQAKSFDPTDVGTFINRCADPPIDFDVEKPVVDGRQYVVFVVRRFADLPHVCVYSLDHELQQGAFYIRTQDAASRVAYRAHEVRGLVQRALRNQREVLGRMLRGVLYENRQTGESGEVQPFQEQLARSRHVLERLPLGSPAAAGIGAEVVAYPNRYTEQRFALSELRRAAGEVACTFRRWPFAPLGSDAQTYVTNVSLRSYVEEVPVFWQAFQTGLFHHQTRWPRAEPLLPYDELRGHLAEAIFFLGQFYTALGCAEELITLDLTLEPVEHVALLLARDAGREERYTCRIPTIRLQLVRSAADLASGVTEHAARVVREVCERFNLPAGHHGDLEQALGLYLQRHPAPNGKPTP